MDDTVNSKLEEWGQRRISRRRVFARFGGAGALALLGAGLLDAVGARSASAQSIPRSASPASECPPGEYPCDLAEGHCGGPCPSGFFSYNCKGIYDCLPSNGEPYVCV